MSDEIDIKRRFSGVSRLYGDAGLAKLQAAHVVVIGVGGVGSWAAEALARNAVGHITLIDLDNIAESNVNRQIHALEGNFGKAKVVAMQERLLAINPLCKVQVIEEFIAKDTMPAMLDVNADIMIDCIDDVNAKVALAAFCKKMQLPLIMVGGAGGRLDPTRIAVEDLSRAKNDRMLSKVRTMLRTHHGYPRGVRDVSKKSPKMKITCVYSNELAIMPEAACDSDEGVTGLNCAGYGSSVGVTATMGFAASAWALQQLVKT